MPRKKPQTPPSWSRSRHGNGNAKLARISFTIGTMPSLGTKVAADLVIAEIKERKAARKKYEKAKAAGKRASLLEQERPNIFTTSVANIGPGEKVAASISYQQILLFGYFDHWRGLAGTFVAGLVVLALDHDVSAGEDLLDVAVVDGVAIADITVALFVERKAMEEAGPDLLLMDERRIRRQRFLDGAGYRQLLVVHVDERQGSLGGGLIHAGQGLAHTALQPQPHVAELGVVGFIGEAVAYGLAAVVSVGESAVSVIGQAASRGWASCRPSSG